MGQRLTALQRASWIGLLLVGSTVPCPAGPLHPALAQRLEADVHANGRLAHARGREQPVYFALLVGNNVIPEDEALPPLEFADNDVARFALALRAFVPPERQVWLARPDDDAAAILDSVGPATRGPATLEAFRVAFADMDQTIQAWREGHPGHPVVLILFFSAHGNNRGVFLEDGTLPGVELQYLLTQASADRVLLVADACFSKDWLVLKGNAEQADTTTKGATAPVSAPGPDEGGTLAVPLPEDVVARAVAPLSRVAAITAQAMTREGWGLLRGGLLTHVVASGLMGAADVDRDGRILYEEMAAYLDTYAVSHKALQSIVLKIPHGGQDARSVLVDFSSVPPTGLRFLSTTSKAPSCYWVRAAEGDIVAELCIAPHEARSLYLPPGTYRVQQRVVTAGPCWMGRERTLTVKNAFESVRLDAGWGYWTVGGTRAAGLETAIPATATRLSAAELAYLEQTPIRRAVTWRDLSHRQQPALRTLVTLPGYALMPLEVVGAKEATLSQEAPFYGVGGLVDRRVARAGRYFVTVGAELDAAFSLDNLVGACKATVLATEYKARVGLERRVASWTWHTTLEAGGASAWPMLAEPASQSQGLSTCSTSGYGRWFLPLTQLELAFSHRLPGGHYLEVGGGPRLVVEPQAIDQGVIGRLPFLGATLFGGYRF